MSVRYREGLQPAIADFSLALRSGEKVKYETLSLRYKNLPLGRNLWKDWGREVHVGKFSSEDSGASSGLIRMRSVQELYD